MGLFNAIRNAYRKVTGQLSLEQEADYRKWSSYNGKIRKASAPENLAVNTALQIAIYEKDKKFVQAAELRKSRKEDLGRYNAIAYRANRQYTPEKLVSIESRLQEEKVEFYQDGTISLLERRFKLSLVNYVKAYYWDISLEKQKAIYQSLYESYKEIYGTQKSAKIATLSDQLNLKASQKKREVVRKNALEERLAVAA